MGLNAVEHVFLCFVIGFMRVFFVSLIIHIIATYAVYSIGLEMFDLKKVTKEIRPVLMICCITFVYLVIWEFVLNIEVFFSNPIFIDKIKTFQYSFFYISNYIFFLIVVIIIFVLLHSINRGSLKKPIFNFISGIILLPFGVHEYYIAKYFKNTTLLIGKQQSKDIRKLLIRYFNYSNLVASIVCTIYLFILFYNVSDGVYDIQIEKLLYMSGFILIRTCGRSIEIIYAFYKDVTSQRSKTSSLTNAERFKLAIRSFVELLFLYAGVYCILRQQFIINYMIQYGTITDDNFSFAFSMKSISLAAVDSFKNGTIVCSDFLLNAESIEHDTSIFIREFLFAAFTALHTLTNLVLSVLSVARYFSGDEKNNCNFTKRRTRYNKRIYVKLRE